MSLYLGENLISGMQTTVDKSERVGQIVTSTIPLSDAGLHLLDGAQLTYGSYKDFIDYIGTLYTADPTADYFAQPTTVNTYNYVSVGNITDTDGVLRGFSGSAVFAEAPVISPTTSFELVVKVKRLSSSTGASSIVSTITAGYGIVIKAAVTTGALTLYIGNAGTNRVNGTSMGLNLTADTWNWLKVTYNGASYISYISLDGENWTEGATIASTYFPTFKENLMCLGGTSRESAPLIDGYIDLNGSYFKCDGETVWTGVTTTSYSAEEYWWYLENRDGLVDKFVYDGTNHTVRLPLYGNSVLTEGSNDIPVKGNGMTMGFTDGIVNYGLYHGTSAFAAKETMYGTAVGTSNTAASSISKTMGLTTDGSKSGIVADLSAAIPSTIYYYIVVATSTKTDIQVDIDEVMTDLQAKVDKADLYEVQSIVETYQDGLSWYRIYSDGWCEQGGLTPAAAVGDQTIFLLKTYMSSNYQVYLSPSIYTMNAGTTIALGSIKGLNPNSFVCYNSVANQSCFWQAQGYIRM